MATVTRPGKAGGLVDGCARGTPDDASVLLHVVVHGDGPMTHSLNIHLNRYRGSMAEGQGQRERLPRGQRVLQADQHDVVATGRQGDDLPGGNRQRRDGAHLRDALLGQALVHVGRGGNRRADADKSIRLSATLQCDISGAGRRGTGRGACPGFLDTDLAIRTDVCGQNDIDLRCRYKAYADQSNTQQRRTTPYHKRHGKNASERPERTCPEGRRISTTVAEPSQDRPVPGSRGLASGVPGARKGMAASCANGYGDRSPVECPGAGRHLRKTPEGQETCTQTFRFSLTAHGPRLRRAAPSTSSTPPPVTGSAAWPMPSEPIWTGPWKRPRRVSGPGARCPRSIAPR